MLLLLNSSEVKGGRTLLEVLVQYEFQILVHQFTHCIAVVKNAGLMVAAELISELFYFLRCRYGIFYHNFKQITGATHARLNSVGN